MHVHGARTVHAECVYSSAYPAHTQVARLLRVASRPRRDYLDRQCAVGCTTRGVGTAANQCRDEPKRPTPRGDVQRSLPAELAARRRHIDRGAMLDESHERLDLPPLTRALQGLGRYGGG